MVPSSVGSVVLVRFPFSDLSASKLRPGVVLAFAGHNECILCQVTSNPYADSNALPPDDASFARGSLQRLSFARPGKLFTASSAIMAAEIGSLETSVFSTVLEAVIAILRGSRHEH